MKLTDFTRYTGVIQVFGVRRSTWDTSCLRALFW